MNFSNTVLGTNVALAAVAGSPSVIGGADASTVVTFSNTVSLGGSGSLTVDGVGTVVLGGSANIWGGGTTVNGGALLVNGKLNGGAVTVTPATTNTPTLGGSGTILGSVTVQSGGVLAPAGNSSISTLTVSNSVALNSGSTNVMELNRASSPNSDRLVANSISFGGTLTVTNNGSALQANDTFTLFSSGSTSGSFAVTNLPALSSPLSWSALSNGVITVISALPTTPTNITVTFSGGTLSLTWPGSYLGWIAQSNSVSLINTNIWFDIPGSQSVTNLNITVNPGLTNVFYRLRYP
jgi:autotransporter-associated beta strand protein